MNKKVDNVRNQRIQVFARCRPLNTLERKQGSPSIVEVVPEKKEIVVKDRNLNREFFFDKVFPPDVKQVTVYKSVVEPLIQEVLMGYNCTVFAYGQTGTGKTYTMEGERSNAECSWEEDPGAGIIPRSLHQLFEDLTKGDNVEFYVRVSFLELYNEELFDLLSANELSRIQIMSSKKGSVVIQGLQEIIVNTKDEVYAILEKGTARRQTAATMLNATSSRSHTIFSVTVHIKENTVDGEELLKIGKLNLVDLAGSENVGRSGAVDKRAREAGNINQSLLTLGRVITALIEKQPHVPYRESKLTRLLQDSLGGHTKTSIIATISPAQINYDETVSTLDYATKAKSITIKPEVNQKMTKRALIREYQEKIDRLQKDIEATRNKEGFYIASENYNDMLNEIECNKTKIKELEEQLETLIEENKMVEDNLNQVTEEIAKMKQQMEERNSELSQAKQILNNTQKVLEKTALERDEKDCLLSAHCNTEKKLLQQGKAILDVADQSTNDLYKLHAKLDRKSKVEVSNEKIIQDFKDQYQQQFAMMNDMVSTSKDMQAQNFQNIRKSLNQFVLGLDDYKQMSASQLTEIISWLNNELSNSSLLLNEDSTKQKEWMNSLSEDLDSKKNMLFAERETFLTRTLTSLVQKQQMIFSQMEHWIQDGHNELCKKINVLHDNMKALSEKQTETLKEINNTVHLYHERNEMEINDLKKQIQTLTSLHIEREQSDEQEYVKEMEIAEGLYQTYQTYLSFIKQKKETKQQKNGNTSLQISKIKTEGLEDINTEFMKDIKKPLSNMESLEKESDANINSLEEIPNIIKVQEFEIILKNAVKSQESLSSGVTEFIQSNQKKEETSVCNIQDSIKSNFSFHQSNHEKIISKFKAMPTTLAEKADFCESSLEEKNKYLLNTVSHTEDIINNCESEINLVAENLKIELPETYEKFEKFISEELQKDLPTGTTPLRKTYDYPKLLAVTSPHDRILQRIRSYQNDKMNLAVNLPLESSFKESDEFKSPSSDDITESTLINRSFTSDADFCSTDCETESNASSMSDLSVVGLRNKENSHNFPKPSNLPKLKKTKEFRKPPRPASNRRKPLISKNPQTDS